MMKIILLFFLLISGNVCALSQQRKSSVSGTYINGKGDTIIINKNCFTYIENTDTLAQYQFSFINSCFIEFLSGSILYKQPEVIVVSQKDSLINKDSVKIVILNKNEKDFLLKMISPKSTPVLLVKDSLIVMTDKRFLVPYLNFLLYPIEYIKRVDAKFYGQINYLYLKSIEHIDDNYYRILIRGVDDKLFNVYFMDGEYVMVSKQKLKWRGQIWHRITN